MLPNVILMCVAQHDLELEPRSTRFNTALQLALDCLNLPYCKPRCPLCTQALLQELLARSGTAELPADEPSHRRLACHVSLLKQLLQVGVFGPLQVKILLGHQASEESHPLFDTCCMSL